MGSIVQVNFFFFVINAYHYVMGFMIKKELFRSLKIIVERNG